MLTKNELSAKDFHVGMRVIFWQWQCVNYGEDVVGVVEAV